MPNEDVTDLLVDLVLIVQRLEREGIELDIDDIQAIRKAKTYLGYSNPVSLEMGTGSLVNKRKENK